MQHINLDAQGDAVKEFFRSLHGDPEGAVVELNGRPVVRLVPIPGQKNGEAETETTWTKEKNNRRGFLIDREIDGTLTAEEAQELAVLERQMQQYLDRVAPLPLEGTRRLYDELLAKAEAARRQ